METEILTCLSCSSTWKRKRTRGRKPKLCPSCVIDIKEDIEEEDDIPFSNKKFKEGLDLTCNYPPVSSWLCKACGVHLQVSIGLNVPPSHKCQKRANRLLALEQSS